MSSPLFIHNDISIAASASRVWDALTNPEQTKKYMFGCEALSDWKKGSPLLWKGNFNGVELVAVKGTIEEIRPGQYLAYSVIDPNSGMEDIPENYLHVTIDLKEENGHTLLHATQGDYNAVGNGRERYEHSIAGNGWEPILVKIKELVEG
jgi:uncharacterized protein YndB with AHSA1/START domain